MLQPLATDELDNAYEVLESQAIISLSKPINGKNKQQRVCFMVWKYFNIFKNIYVSSHK